MRKLAVALGIIAVVLVLFIDVRPSSSYHPKVEDSTPVWKVIIGSVFALSWLTFVVTSVVCTFYIDRKKVAEAEYWIPAGYTFPPRRYLKEGGQVFASIRKYTLILSAILLCVVLAIFP